MANEITLTAAITFSRAAAPTYSEALSFGGIQIDQAGTDYSGGSQEIGTSQETLGKGSITTIGYVIIKNLDATNLVQLGSVSGELGITLKAGEVALFRVSAAQVYAQANSAACNVQYLLIEN